MAHAVALQTVTVFRSRRYGQLFPCLWMYFIYTRIPRDSVTCQGSMDAVVARQFPWQNWFKPNHHACFGLSDGTNGWRNSFARFICGCVGERVAVMLFSCHCKPTVFFYAAKCFMRKGTTTKKSERKVSKAPSLAKFKQNAAYGTRSHVCWCGPELHTPPHKHTLAGKTAQGGIRLQVVGRTGPVCRDSQNSRIYIELTVSRLPVIGSAQGHSQGKGSKFPCELCVCAWVCLSGKQNQPCPCQTDNQTGAPKYGFALKHRATGYGERCCPNNRYRRGCALFLASFASFFAVVLFGSL